VICKFVAEHQTLHLQESTSDPGILQRHCAHVAQIAPSPGISMPAQLQMR
jgi:hypothetical protein